MTPLIDIFLMALTAWGFMTLLCIHFGPDEYEDQGSIRSILIGFLFTVLLVCWFMPMPMD